MSAPTLAAHLACPRCEQSLRQYPDRSWGCGACGLGFPSLLDVPCLFAEPAATLTEWRGRLQFSLEKLAHEAALLQTELQNPRLRPLTRDRLTLLNRATLDQLKRLRELLAPLAVHQAQAALATHLALQTRLPGDQGLTTYYQNIHRDWAWGDEENEATLRLVGGALPPHDEAGVALVEPSIDAFVDAVAALRGLPPGQRDAHRERLGVTDGGSGTRESRQAISQTDFTGDDGPHGAFGLKETLS